MRHRRTEEALLASAARAPEILELMSEGFVSFDREWKYKYVNRSAEEIFGVSRDHLLGKSLWDASPGSAGREFRSFLMRAEKEHVPLSFEGKHPILDRFYQNNVYPTPDGVAVFFRDITAEKHNEEARSRLAQRLELALRAAMATDWRWNFETGEFDCSPNFREISGFAPDEPVTYDTWMRHVDPLERQAVEATIKDFSKGSTDRFEIEFRTLTSGGQARWMYARGLLERAPGGTVTGAIGITLDITEKKKTELALRESEERFRTLSEVVPQLVWQTDAEGLVDHWNQRWYDYTGQTPPEATGWGWMTAVHPDDRARVYAAWAAAFKEQAIPDLEYRIRRHDGEYRWFVDRGQPARDDFGRIVRWFGTCTDITQRKSAEAALQESEERFRAVFEQASAGVALVALDGKYLQVNSRFCEITGYSQDELRHLGFQDLSHPDDLQSCLEQVNKLISGQVQRFALRSRNIRKDERVSWMYVSPALVRDASGQPQYMVWVVEDIDYRERTRLQLEEQKQRLDAALMASDTGTFRWALHADIFQADENLERLLGLQPGKAPRTLDQFISLIIAEDRDRVVENRNRCALQGGNFEDVFRVVWPDGTVHWLRDRGETIPDERGQPAFLTGACVDITGQMEIQQQLQNSRELLLLAQEAAGVGTWEWDLTTDRTKLSPEVYRMFGIPEPKEPAPIEERLKLIHPEDRPKVQELWERLASGNQERGEVEFRVASGPSSRWISWKGRALRDRNDRPICVVGAGLDVTDRRKDEEARRSSEKLTAAWRLAKAIAHEINNPLEAVVNVFHLIQNSSSLEEAKKYSGIGRRELDRVVHTARHALRFNRQVAHPTSTKVSALVDAIAALFQHRFRGAHVELKLDFHDTQPIMCFADELRQLFGNLIGNALDATPPGGRVILRVLETPNVRTGERGRHVFVADTGKGMSKAVQDHLFEPFFSTKEMTGMGLGLWISLEIVKRHGGTIRIRSRETGERHGTVVSVFLPEHSSLVAASKAA